MDLTPDIFKTSSPSIHKALIYLLEKHAQNYIYTHFQTTLFTDNHRGPDRHGYFKEEYVLFMRAAGMLWRECQNDLH